MTNVRQNKPASRKSITPFSSLLLARPRTRMPDVYETYQATQRLVLVNGEAQMPAMDSSSGMSMVEIPVR